MKNKSITKYLCAIALTFCLGSSLCSCSNGEISGGGLPNDDFTAAVDDGADSELYKRYTTYKKDMEEAFLSTPAAPTESFVLEQVEGGVKIVDYVSDAKVVRIPGQLLDGRSVVGIAENVFADKNMRAIYVPDSVTEMDRGALAGCNGLLTLRLPEIFGGYLGYVFGADEYGENATTVPASLDRLILGGSVTSIPDNAFSGCKTLSGVRIVGEIDEIGEFAFYGCSDLVCVDINKVTKISEYAFGECASLYEMDCSSSSDVELGAFYGCVSLNKITLSNIGDEDSGYLGYVFGAETAEYSARYVPSSLRTVAISGPCQQIGARSFAECKYITKVILGEGVQSIDVRAFYRCRSLSDMVIPDTLVSIGDDAFFGCDNLVSVTFGKNTASIGMQAFMGCKSLKEITMPDGVTEIKASTFYGCSALEKIDLKNVKKIGKDAFGGCDSLVPIPLDGVDVADGNEALVAVVAKKK